MKWYGLTGGIGTGKSTVTGILRDFGLAVVDADAISRELTSPHSFILEKLTSEFGAGILNVRGELDRNLLGKVVFANAEQRSKLENILHPEIQKIVQIKKRELTKAGERVAFYDVPLLFEKKLESQFDKIMVVFCSPEQQFERVKNRNPQLSDSEVLKRIAAQIPIEQKKKGADYLIDNSRDLEFLKQQVQSVVHQIRADL